MRIDVSLVSFTVRMPRETGTPRRRRNPRHSLLIKISRDLTRPVHLILVDGITKRFNRGTKLRAGKIAGKLPADVTGMLRS